MDSVATCGRYYGVIFQYLRYINNRLDASKLQKIWDEDKENVLVECSHGQLSSTDGQSGQKKTQNKTK